MPRDFDAALSEDRAFTIGGEEFVWQYVHWRTFAEWMDSESGPSENGSDRDDSLLGSFERVIDRIVLYLPAEDHERFRAMVNDPGRAVPFVQLNTLAEWLLEEQTLRPTEVPTTSTAGRGRTRASSKVASS